MGRGGAPRQVQALRLEMRERKRNSFIHIQELRAPDSLEAASWKDKLLQEVDCLNHIIASSLAARIIVTMN